MSDLRPIFVTGTARGGTSLVARMLDAHRDVAVAVDPFFPLFRLVRDALLGAAGLALEAGSPLQDYYCSDARIVALDAVQQGDLAATAVEAGCLPGLREALARRAALDASDLVPHLDLVGGGDARALVEGALAAVRAARGAETRWVGCKDVWIVELFRPLARAFPDARFVLVHRDPRAVVASMLALADEDETQLAHPLSYARHWRKGVAFGLHYARDPLFDGRLLVLRYEDVVLDPGATARALCEHLEVDPDDAMLDPDAFVDRGTGRAWAGNSSYADVDDGISADRVDRWRDTLDPRAHALVELVCGPELQLAGYVPAAAPDDAPGLRAYLTETGLRPGSWRSDLGDPELDLACERERRAALAHGGPPDAVRRGFLFAEVFEACRSTQPEPVR